MGALLPARGSGALIATILAYAAMTAVVFHNLLPSMTTAIYSSIGDPLLNTSVARLFESRMWTVYEMPRIGSAPRVHVPLLWPAPGSRRS